MSNSYLLESLKDLGLSATHSKPVGKVSDNWVSVSYESKLFLDGSLVWQGPYSLGIGHIKIPKVIQQFTLGLTEREFYMLQTMQRRPHANFVNRDLQAGLFAKLAISQKVEPELCSLVHCLLSDGSTFFDFEDFEGFCANFGYDVDSIKAFETWQSCEKTGRQLARGLGLPLVSQLRKLLENY